MASLPWSAFDRVLYLTENVPKQLSPGADTGVRRAHDRRIKKGASAPFSYFPYLPADHASSCVKAAGSRGERP